MRPESLRDLPDRLRFTAVVLLLRNILHFSPDPSYSRKLPNRYRVHAPVFSTVMGNEPNDRSTTNGTKCPVLQIPKAVCHVKENPQTDAREECGLTDSPGHTWGVLRRDLSNRKFEDEKVAETLSGTNRLRCMKHHTELPDGIQMEQGIMWFTKIRTNEG